MAGMTIDNELGARLSAVLTEAMRLGDYAFAAHMRSAADELLVDGELRLKLYAAIADAEVADDARQVARLAEVLRLAEELGLRWADEARQVLGLGGKN